MAGVPRVDEELTDNILESTEETDSNRQNIKTIRVCVCGRTGEGKSELCNALVGKKAAFKVGHDFDPQTKVVEFHSYSFKYGSFTYEFQIYDSPGFNDGNDQEYLGEIKKQCPKPDVLLYCINCNSDVVFLDKLIIDSLGKIFERTTIENTVFISTHADQLRIGYEGMGEANWRKEYCKKVNDRKESLRRILKTSLGVRQFPIVFTGLSKVKVIQGDLYNRPWLAQVFHEILKQIQEMALFKCLIKSHPFTEYTDYLEDSLALKDSPTNSKKRQR